jgi:hypothetical protein
MIPDAVARLLERAHYFAAAGTRDAAMVPRAHRLWGVRIDDDCSVTVLVPAYGVDDLELCLADNARIAIFVGEQPSHESYQLKGRALRVGVPSEADRAFFRQYRDTFVTHLAKSGYPEAVVRSWMPEPALSVTVRVEEAYAQTPGPNAGAPLWLEAAAE